MVMLTQYNFGHGDYIVAASEDDYIYVFEDHTSTPSSVMILAQMLGSDNFWRWYNYSWKQ